MAREGGGAKVTVWFDSGCPLCRREIALMRRLDRRAAITFVDIGDTGGEEGGGGACPIDRAELLARFHAREEGGGGGRLVSGAEAFTAMWRAIPLLRPIGLMARNRLILALFEQVYRGFLRIRPRVQRMAAWLDRAR